MSAHLILSKNLPRLSTYGCTFEAKICGNVVESERPLSIPNEIASNFVAEHLLHTSLCNSANLVVLMLSFIGSTHNCNLIERALNMRGWMCTAKMQNQGPVASTLLAQCYPIRDDQGVNG